MVVDLRYPDISHSQWVSRKTASVFPWVSGSLAYDWSDTNVPWAYTSASDWENQMPAGVTVTNIQTGSSDFYTNLSNTVNAAAGRVIVRLAAGDYILNKWRMIGSSGDPTYSFGFWFPKLAGLTGAGPDQTFVSFAANSPVVGTDGTTDVTASAMTTLSQMTQASFAPNQIGFCRIDTTYNSTGAPIFIGGITFRAAAQQMLTSVSSDITGGGAPVMPQSMPHNGVTIYGGNLSSPNSVVSHCRFQGAGKAMTSQPPFEHANFGSQKNQITFYNCEFDGRISDIYDSSRPRKCGPWMGNGEVLSSLNDSWFHHSNVSRYAANDESVISSTALSNHYALTRCKFEQITNTENNGNGGVTNASLAGWESSNALIELTNCIMLQDNPNVDSHGSAQHAGLTVTTTDRAGGRFSMTGCVFHNSGFPALEGFLTLRVAPNTSHWYVDGVATTITIKDSPTSAAKIANVYTGTWPPSASYISSNGLSPTTHYILKAT